jgi:hypothetical protein
VSSLPRGLFLILIVALLLRIGLVIAQPMTAESLDRLPDQREYFSIAENLLRHGSLSFFDPRVGQKVYAYRMPGYPVFLVACGGSVEIARLVQCLLDTSTVLAVFLIASRLSGCTRLGRLAAFAVAVNPFYIFFSSLILSETLFTTLLVWGMYFLLRFPKWTAILGLWLLIAATYVRPLGYLLVPAVGFAAALNLPRRSPYRLSEVLRPGLIRAVPLTLLYSAVLALAMAPWAYRNHKLLGSWVWSTTNSGITLYDGFHQGANGASDQRFLPAMPAVLTMNEVARSLYFATQARQWATAHPIGVVFLSLKKSERGWSPVPLSQDFGKLGYVLVSAAYSIPFDLLCLVGLFSSRLSRQAKLLIATPAASVTLGMLLSVGSIRYRMPAEAPLAVLAACGAMDIVKRLRRAKAPKFEERNLE